jgi:ABC-2 type transport system ATP-binding protein
MEFMSNAAVRIVNLGFIYPRQQTACFSNLTLEVQQGERFGLFGPNGAGKTTLMNCMTGLLNYQQGSVQLLGNEIAHHKKSVNKLFGFVPQDLSFYQELSP